MTDTQPSEFRSNDMGCVAFLMVQGHSSQRLEFDGGTGYWVFLATSKLYEDVEAFQQGTARVDPRQYNQRYAEAKRQFFNAKS